GWVSVPEYLDALDRRLGVNVVAMVGHSTLRYHVMGPAAIEREATEEEIRAMCRVLREGIEAGAFGLTTSRAPSHFGWHGEPVPSRLASVSELQALADTLGELGATAMGLIPQGLFSGMSEEDKALILDLGRRARATIQLNGVSGSDAWDFMAAAAREGVQIYGVFGSQPFYKIFSLNTGTTTFNSMDTWFAIMSQPPAERLRRFADPALRPTLRTEVDAEATADARTMRRPRIVWDQFYIHKTVRPEHKTLEGKTIPQLAAERGVHKADALLDLALSEDGETQFLFRFMPESAWLGDPARKAILNHPHVTPLNSDAGAHIASECKSGESTYFLRNWVLQNGVMSLEEGVRKITAEPAARLGLTDRGRLQEGLVADIAVLDLDRLDTAPKEPAFDLPGGGMRWVQRPSGVEHVLVNGTFTIRNGQETGALPARVLRSGAYRRQR
ncbi:MAG: amidohydrolase family protein, partial [Dehalococcoidia bacterium]|nr:amidohydrolase family protein [Dehalococcoidia bacterium]